jgi:hypothetical protein
MSVPCELFRSGLYNVIYDSKEKLYPEIMKAAIEAVSNKEMGSYKASRVFNLPQKHHSVMSKRTEKLK